MTYPAAWSAEDRTYYDRLREDFAQTPAQATATVEQWRAQRPASPEPAPSSGFLSVRGVDRAVVTRARIYKATHPGTTLGAMVTEALRLYLDQQEGIA